MTLDEFLALPGARRHDGGPCPVPHWALVFPLYRSGHSTNNAHAARAFDWSRNMMNYIIAYREAQP